MLGHLALDYSLACISFVLLIYIFKARDFGISPASVLGFVKEK